MRSTDGAAAHIASGAAYILVSPVCGVAAPVTREAAAAAAAGRSVPGPRILELLV
jgi:hypothetical protein